MEAANNHEVLISIEEGSVGGFGSHVMQFLSDRGDLLDKYKHIIGKVKFSEEANCNTKFVQAVSGYIKDSLTLK